MRPLTQEEQEHYAAICEHAANDNLSVFITTLDKDTPQAQEVAVLCLVFEGEEPDNTTVQPLAILTDDSWYNRLDAPNFELNGN